MKYLFILSWKNLARHTKRTLITASAIAFGLGLFIFVDSMLAGAEKDSERNLIWYETGSVRIYSDEKAEDWKRINLKNLLDNPDDLIGRLEDAGISATKRTAFTGELIVYQDPFPEDGSMQVRLMAVDAMRDSDVFPIEDAIEDGGRWLEPGGNGVIMGSWLADDIGAEVGYPVTVVTRTRDGAFQTLDLEVVGLVNTGNPVINRGTMLIDHDYADDYLLLNGAAGQVDTAFPLTAPSAENLAAVTSALGSALAGHSLLTWEDLGADYLSLAAAKQGGSKSILSLVVIIALVGITNTMLMAMYERRRELGMMRAMGMKNWEIVTSFTMEAGGIGVIGGLMGMILGALLTWFIVDVGIDFGFITRDMDIGYRIATVFRGIWKADTFVVAFLSSIIMAMAVSLIPTRQALKMKVTDCLRSDT
jgi:putative ABC transport system permease protein